MDPRQLSLEQVGIKVGRGLSNKSYQATHLCDTDDRVRSLAIDPRKQISYK